LAANPVPPIIRARLFYYLMPQGRFQEAVQEIKTALEQDPLNVPIRSLLSLSLNFAGLYDPAILEARKALEIDEKVWIPHWVIGQSLALRRIFAEAREPAEIAFRLAPWHPMVVGSLAGILACLGERERSDQLLMDLPETSSAGRVIYHLLGSETEAAADWYEKEIELRQPTAVLWSRAGFLKLLRESPRWPRLANLMNLPEVMERVEGPIPPNIQSGKVAHL
jgi:tetratricopeptide (TPR) repeat protein